jgi:hypothetical protein
LSAVTACWLSPHICAADASTYRNPRDQLALELAVVAAHEGALDNTPDTALVWQVVESRASTTQGRINFLRAHSPRALGRKACNYGNCVWSQELLEAPDEPPASLSAAWWTATRAESWQVLRRYASELVYGIELWRPCPAAPYSWGYAGDLKSAWIERRLVPLGCEGTMNDGFRVAPPSLTALWHKQGAIEARRARYRSHRKARSAATDACPVDDETVSRSEAP